MPATLYRIRGKKYRGRIVSGADDICCHRVSYWYDLCGYPTLSDDEAERLREQLENDAYDRAREMIYEGCYCGDLCSLFVYDNGKDVEIFGNWTIER